MPGGYNSSRRIVSQLRPFADRTICKSCLSALLVRHASTATATSSSPETPEPNIETPLAEAPATTPFPYMVKAGVVLSRPPLLTRELHPFEKAFFFYQRRLNEKLALPFTRYFYYQKDTPADINWRQKLRKRLTPAHDLGVFNAFGADRDRDELLVGATESEPQKQVEDLLNEAVVEVQHPDAAQAAAALKEKAGKVERPLPRETEADRNGDMRSLNRALAKTLYLIVKGADGCWMFPHSGLLGKESLHRASERIIVQAGGVNMNTWIVGHAPVGFYEHNFVHPVVTEKGFKQLGEKIFFMKARIMAGQANLKGNVLGLQDFKWVAKDELKKEVHPHYWKRVKNMLVER